MWIFGGKSESGFNATNNAEQVTERVHGTALTAIVTGATNGIGKETARVIFVLVLFRNIALIIGVAWFTSSNDLGSKVLDEDGVTEQVLPGRIHNLLRFSKARIIAGVCLCANIPATIPPTPIYFRR